MSIHYEDHGVTLHHGDCLEVLPEIPDGSVDAVVTDPPYGLGFMGKAWDALPPGDEWARECLRVLKPGGHLLAFGGTRTWHRLAVAVEDAGLEIRDSIAWLYGSGFPKSLDVSKAIDKAADVEREIVGQGAAFGSGSLRNRSRVEQGYRPTELNPEGGSAKITAPATPEAERWQGWGTALKPAFEPIVVARKPLQGTVAANVLEHGTGALNIDGCRIGTSEDTRRNAAGGNNGLGGSDTFKIRERRAEDKEQPAGRWPANVILDESQAATLDEQSGTSTSKIGKPRGSAAPGDGWGMTQTGSEYDDTGGASRYFYTAKADQSERITHNGTAHPTVKPLDLMRWLVRLVTQPGGTILEPFAGSGTTVEAALLEGFQVIGIEREADYLPLIIQRIQRRRDPIKYLAAAGDELGLFADDQGDPYAPSQADRERKHSTTTGGDDADPT